jgi:P27 family predicted phage terminase small subunit
LKPGPKPKPNAIRRLAGGKQPQNPFLIDAKAPTTGAGGIPSCPAFLGSVATAEYKRVTKELSKVPGLLAMVDRSCLVEYSISWAMVKEAAAHLAKEGATQTIQGAHGYEALQVSPWVGVQQQYLASMRKASDRLGFNPSARASIHLTPSDAPTFGRGTSPALTPPRSVPPRRLPPELEPEPVVVEAVLSVEVPQRAQDTQERAPDLPADQPQDPPSGREPDIEPDQPAADVPEQDTSPDQWIEGRRQTG